MSILGAIANPQMADIGGALDARQARLDRDEARRKEIRAGQLIAEALPNIKAGSALHELATNSPQQFALVAKALGVPLNAGDQLQELTDDVANMYTRAQADPSAALEYAHVVKEQRNKAGRETPQLDKFLAAAAQDPATAMTGLFVMHRALNRDEAVEDRRLDQQDRALDIQEGRMLAGAAGGSEMTAKQKEWEQYKRLKDEDPEEGSRFGRSVGFESREGQTLSAFAEKQIDGAFNEYTEASGNVNRYSTLADNLRKADMAGGLKSTWTEYVKEQTGNQDEITALRKEAKQIANSEGIKNLPPGPATDRDIEIVMAPFPTEKASPEYIANWLGAMARLNEKRAQYAEFKADFISANGSVRNRDGQSLVAAWKESQAGQEAQEDESVVTDQSPAAESSQQFTGQDKAAYDWATANPNDPRSAAILQKLGVR